MEGFQTQQIGDLGIRSPAQLKFIKIIKGSFLLGARVVAVGDVLAVSEPTGRISIMPADTRLYRDRAEKLIRDKKAEPHPGPATTTTVGHNPLDGTGVKPIETTMAPQPSNAERSVAPRQGRGTV